MSSSSAKKLITLKSNDNQIFEVEESVASFSQTIKHVIDDGCANSPIPLPNITGPVLALIIRYCENQLKKADKSEEVNNHDFMKKVTEDTNMLFDLIMAANYLNIKSLLDFLCEAAANMLKGQSVEEIRKIFNVKNDFTEEEIEEMKRENQWVFD